MTSFCSQFIALLPRSPNIRNTIGACTLAILIPNLQIPLCAQPRPAFTLDVAHPDWVASEPFTWFNGMRLLSNGNAIVTDLGEITVRLLGPNGETVRTIGRTGAGPGEYTMPTAVIPLPGDTTLLLDRDARRYILLGPTGNIVATRALPLELGEGAAAITAADAMGNLYFQGDAPVVNGVPTRTAAIARWRRNATRFDTVAQLNLNLAVSNAATIQLSDGGEGEFQAIERPRFGANDNWLAAQSGRVAIVHAEPYRVEWVERNGRRTLGKPQQYSPVPVTIADKKSLEPKGPPFRRVYATNKPSFVDGSAVVDDVDNIWVQRSGSRRAAQRRWDIFDAKGNPAGFVEIPANTQIVAVNQTHLYLLRRDDNDEYWLERHTRR